MIDGAEAHCSAFSGAHIRLGTQNLKVISSIYSGLLCVLTGGSVNTHTEHLAAFSDLVSLGLLILILGISINLSISGDIQAIHLTCASMLFWRVNIRFHQENKYFRLLIYSEALLLWQTESWEHIFPLRVRLSAEFSLSRINSKFGLLPYLNAAEFLIKNQNQMELVK